MNVHHSYTACVQAHYSASIYDAGCSRSFRRRAAALLAITVMYYHLHYIEAYKCYIREDCYYPKCVSLGIRLFTFEILPLLLLALRTQMPAFRLLVSLHYSKDLCYFLPLISG